jgi:hypothetical protein
MPDAQGPSQKRATVKPDCGLCETPQIVKRWNSKSTPANLVKNTLVKPAGKNHPYISSF